MKEYVTEAIVLGTRPVGEADRLVDIYTKALGRVELKATGGRKIVSKLAPHLGTGHAVLVRFVAQRQMTATDALMTRGYLCHADTAFAVHALGLFALCRALLPLEVRDDRVWYELVRSLDARRIELRTFLKLFGYDVTHAECARCGSREVAAFHAAQQEFWCARCGARRSFEGSMRLEPILKTPFL